MRTDDGRTIIVVAQGPHLSAAVRDRVPREVALVRWAQAGGVAAAWERCRPWPWVVIGSGPPAAEVSARIAGRPVVVAWLRDPEAAGRSPLPPHWIALDGWTDLVAWLRHLANASVDGLTLAPHRGVSGGDGERPVPAPGLEALLAAHPHAIADCATMRGARSALRRLSVPCTLQASGGGIRLASRLPGNIRNGGDCR
jgi:hypothetical protein